ncbi:MAG: AEC family transporter [Stomatobaculum sp.]|nr:AEC family transporter [Stomatobaculum sp.]
MNSFWISFNAVIPFVLYLAFGYGVRRAGLADIAFLRKLNKVSFQAFFPLLMFDNMYTIGDSFPLTAKFFAFAMASFVVTIGGSFAVVPKIIKDQRQIPVIIQGVYRSNILLFAVPLVQNLFGDSEMVMAAALVVIVVPVYNVTATIILEMYSGREKSSPLKFLISILTTPLILGAWVGFLFKLLNVPIAPPVMKVIGQFADMTTPLALFILGGTLEFVSLGKHMKMLTVVMAIKMILVPAGMLFFGTLIGLSTMERFLALALYATPVATATFPMAQVYGADADLAGEQVVLTTICSVVILFFWIVFMQSMGMI